MAYEALRHYSDRAMTFRFVSNVDGTDFVEAVRDLDPAETLFIVSSKTFTTLETMTNAQSARDWLLQGPGRRSEGRGQAFRGRLDQRREGLEVRHRHRQHVRVLGLGRRALFDGLGHRPLDDAGHRPGELPRHAGRLPPDGRALPHRAVRATICRCCMGLLAVWYNDFFGAQTVAVLPYEQYLKRFPAYLQQLTMESNGKHVTLDGSRGHLRDRPDLLGRAGNQRPALLLPVDPPGDQAHPLRLHRVLRTRSTPLGRHHDMLHGECLRPDRGAGLRQDAPSRSRPRARPTGSCRTGSSRATARRTRSLPSDSRRKRSASLSPFTSTASSPKASIWNIDSFDQWGVELGKVLAQRIIPELESKADAKLGHDSSTNNLIRRYRKLKGAR